MLAQLVSFRQASSYVGSAPMHTRSFVSARSTRFRFGSILPPRQQRGQEQAPQDTALSSSHAPPSCQGCLRPVQDGGRGAPKSAPVSACGPDRESGPRRSWSWVTALRRCWQLHRREARHGELVGLGDPTRVDEYRTGSAAIGATPSPFDSDSDSGAAHGLPGPGRRVRQQLHHPKSPEFERSWCPHPAPRTSSLENDGSGGRVVGHRPHHSWGPSGRSDAGIRKEPPFRSVPFRSS